MALYRLSNSVISRSKGQSAPAAAAYRSGTVIRDDRLGIVHDYSKKGNIAWTMILSPEVAPDWARSREQLWNQVEATEARKDSQVARECLLALPKELAIEQQIELIQKFSTNQFVQRGMVADLALHTPKDNPHVHILLTMRDLHPDGFGLKNRDWNQRSWLKDLRKGWADDCNMALAAAGVEERVNHRSLADQGSDRIPQIHLGSHAARCLETGQHHPRVERYLEIASANERIAQLRGQAIAVQQEIDQEKQQQREFADQVLPIASSLFEQRAKAGLAIRQVDGGWKVECGDYAITVRQDAGAIPPGGRDIEESLSVAAAVRGELVRSTFWVDGQQQFEVVAGLSDEDVGAFAELQDDLPRWQQQHWVEQVAPVAAAVLDLASESEWVGKKLTIRYESQLGLLTVQDSGKELMLSARWQDDRWLDRGSRLRESDVAFFQDQVQPQIQAAQLQQHQEWVAEQMRVAMAFFHRQSKAGRSQQNAAGEAVVEWGDYQMVLGQDQSGDYFTVRAAGRGDLVQQRSGQRAIELGHGLTDEDASAIQQVKDWLEKQRQIQKQIQNSQIEL